MKNFAKLALGALVVAGATTFAAAAPAQAQVSFSVGVGGGGYYGPPAYSYSCDPYSRWYDPYRCGYYAPRPYAYYAPRVYYRSPSYYRGGYRDGYRGGYRHHR